MTSEQVEQPNYSALATLIRALGKRVNRSRLRTADEIRAIEQMYDLLLPQDYRQFLANYGVLKVDDIAIFGIGDAEHAGLFVEDAILMLRLAHPFMPLHLVPIEGLGAGRFACLACQLRRADDAPVVLVDVAQMPASSDLQQLAPSFRSYLYNRLVLLIEPAHQHEGRDRSAHARGAPLPQYKAHGLKVLKEHVHTYQEHFDYDHASGGKLPRNHDWRPYRFCIQDVLFGTVVVRHDREANCLETDVFLTAEIPEYGPLAGARALATFLLSEAYKCGGTMELRFTREVEDGQVPAELRALASRYDLHFREADRGRIAPSEAKMLYAALTGFSPALQEQINALERAGRIKMARACYAVHHGVWSREQIEMIALGSQRPDSVLAGLVQPHQRHLYAHDLLHARAALLGGMLDRQLARRERRDATGTSYDLEDDIRPLEIIFDGDYYAKGYRSDELIGVPWLHDQSRAIEILAGSLFYVLVRARDAADMLLHLESDLRLAQQLRDQRGQPVFILVPNDFTTLPDAFAQRLVDQAEALKIRLMVCPETVLTFDADAAERLARSRILRK